MQVILGAGGAIGKELARELKSYTNKIRLVCRNPQKVNPDDELFKADLLNKKEVDEAVKGTKIAYLTVGLQYNTKVWQNQWPVVVQNVLEACKKHKTKLLFFDNIYMYNTDKLNPMTEETEVLPSAKKGKVRAEIAQMLLDEMASGNAEILIARSADFYGPGINNSVLMETVYKNLRSGKKANWFCSTEFLHNFTYTPDAAKATARLGNISSAYGQVWHLPTVEPLTGKEWIEAFAREMGVQPKTMVIPKFMIQVMGLFNSVMKEFVEMLYQYDRDYNFDSSKYETVFRESPTPVKLAIREIVGG